MEVKIKIRLRNQSNRNQKINKKKKSVELKAGCLRKSVQLINLWPGQGGEKKKSANLPVSGMRGVASAQVLHILKG